MQLVKLLENYKYKIIHGNIDKQITSIAYNSKDVQKNGVFVAIKGFTTDGHKYIKNAIANEASVIFVEDIPNIQLDNHITMIQVEDTRVLLAHIANVFFERPSENLKITGITGTNGKTSISFFLHSILLEAKRSVSMLGTTGLYKNNQLVPKKFSTVTTPEAIDLQHLLHELVKEDFDNFIMEVSSHGLELHRVSSVNFHTGMFNNLSADHLELHKNFKQYFQAKASLFDLTTHHNIVNVDDPYGKKLASSLQNKDVPLTTVGIKEHADIMAKNIEHSFHKTAYTLQTPTYEANITIYTPGQVYVYNSLMAIAAAYFEEIPKQIIQDGLAKMKNIPGRFNIVYEQNHYRVIIDFAHTDHALQTLLETVKPLVKGRLILVFGVYANMSPQGQQKRFSMGKTAGKYADYSIVTLDNPKHFDQDIIMSQIREGVETETKDYTVIYDREEAIRHAISVSGTDDTIIITGKGHETTQLIGDEEIPIDETKIVLDSLKKGIF